MDVLSFIAAKKAPSLGLSKSRVLAAANRELESEESSIISNEKPAFEASQSCVNVSYVKTRASGKLDGKSSAWLGKNLSTEGNLIEWH